MRTVKIYATVTVVVVGFIVGLLALTIESPPLKRSPQDRAAGVEPIRPVASAPTEPTGGPAPKTDSPGTQTIPKAPDSPVSATPSEGKQEAPPALDLASLEKRLRETKAIGVFTKLSLKNQVDDLRERFRAFHEGRGAVLLAELREQYDLLLLKVLSLLQDSDPPLARDISASREVLWSLLADPAKFRNL